MPERNLRFLINCGAGKRGVYLREARDVNKPSEVVITIEPMYLDNDSTSKLFLSLLDGYQVGSLGETSPMTSRDGYYRLSACPGQVKIEADR